MDTVARRQAWIDRLRDQPRPETPAVSPWVRRAQERALPAKAVR